MSHKKITDADSEASSIEKTSKETDEVQSDRRDFLKGAGVAAAAAATVAGGANVFPTREARADYPVDRADRYVPPGQWWHHFDVEWYEFPSEDPDKVEVWGYTDKLSYVPGEEVSFHVNSSAATFDIKIYRDGLKAEQVHEARSITGKRSPTPKDCYTKGCGWPVLYRWRVPNDLRSGFYLVVFSVMSDEERVEQEAGFVVRVAKPTAPIVFMLSTQTWIAYNDFAGGSLYSVPQNAENREADIALIPRLHIHRPWARGFMRLPIDVPRANDRRHRTRPIGGHASYHNFEWSMANGYAKFCTGAGWAMYERHMATWAEKNGYELDYIAQQDLEANPDILKGYKCLLTAGHDEYYTWNQRDSIDAFIEAGGGFARFGGNAMWHVRIEDAGKVMVGYKGFAEEHDPVKGRLMTGAFINPKVNRPGATTFACDSHFGHLAGIPAAAPRSPGFIVLRPDHWMLEGTDLYYGDAFGTLAAGYEGDGLPITFRDGLAYPTNEFGTPTNIEIAALMFARGGEEKRDHTARIFAEEGYLRGAAEEFYGTKTPTDAQVEKHTRGNIVLAYMPKSKGAVATGPCIDWCYALERDEFVAQITHNILRRFTS